MGDEMYGTRGHSPDDAGGGDVAAAAGANREDRTAAIAAAGVDHAVLRERRRDREAIGLVEVPRAGAGGEVVPADAGARVDDNLRLAAGLDDERRAVRGHARGRVALPADGAGLGVERQQVRRLLVVTEEQQLSLVHDRRAAVPPVDHERAVLGAEVLLPHEGSPRVDRGDLPGPEPRVDALVVGDGAGGREVVLFVHRRETPFRRQFVFPPLAAGPAIERGDEEHDLALAARGSGAERALAGLGGVAALHQTRAGADLAAARLRGHDDEIARHDRGRNAEAADGGLPGDVIAVAPPGWQIALGRNSRRGRPAPLRPLACLQRGRLQHCEYPDRGQNGGTPSGSAHRTPSSVRHSL